MECGYGEVRGYAVDDEDELYCHLNEGAHENLALHHHKPVEYGMRNVHTRDSEATSMDNEEVLNFYETCLLRSASTFPHPGEGPKNGRDARQQGIMSPWPPKASERCEVQYSQPVPVLPVPNHVHREQSGEGGRRGFLCSSFSPVSRRCSWKCSALILILFCLLLATALTYVLTWRLSEGPQSCTDSAVRTTAGSCPSSSSDTFQSTKGSIDPQGDKKSVIQTMPPDGTTFARVSLGELLKKHLPGYGYWNLQFFIMEPGYLRFNWSIPRGASLGIYARRNALPSHTQFHFSRVVQGFRSTSVPLRSTRSLHSPPLVGVEFVEWMDSGHWFVSIYNDDGEEEEAHLVIYPAEEMNSACPRGCSQHGECLLGKCQCHPGYGGDDCSQEMCPELCSGHGEYVGGECICHPGWKGKECHLQHHECEVPDCHGHGQCIDGKCICSPGFKGATCEQVDCPHPTCRGRGFCMDGQCICERGWKGPDCGEMDSQTLHCLPDCSSHGTFSPDTLQCVCDEGWTGIGCSQETCKEDCGENGECKDGKCICKLGWTGPTCLQRLCDPRCTEHGQCKNGTCICSHGWNGAHCSLEGCPSSCSGTGKGRCLRGDSEEWKCVCNQGWAGPDCSMSLELHCSNNFDDDQDGLIDCEDPECCDNEDCIRSQLCIQSADPREILLRKQPPASTASFFQRMKFLIEDGNIQRYARDSSFNESDFWNHFSESRAAVVRGRVVMEGGTGVPGVRVSSSDPKEGFTLTRQGGWFDFLVNGGGSITLQFGRAPFRARYRTLLVPWNQVVLVEDVIMSKEEEVEVGESEGTTKGRPSIPCVPHDHDAMRPLVFPAWKHSFVGGCPEMPGILTESQVLLESLPIPGSGIHLLYLSSRARGFASTLQLRLTPDSVPSLLRRVHLRISIEGSQFSKVFEADPNIKFTFAWDKYNVYRQRVYGVTSAIVHVGYEYEDCSFVIWHVQSTHLLGHDMTISDIGGWNLHIHHHYNFHQGVVERGDGKSMYLSEEAYHLNTLVGTGSRRQLICTPEDCDVASTKAALLAPMALASGPDGSLYIGDFNLIRARLPSGQLSTLFSLNTSSVSYRYYMGVNPVSGLLYVSIPENHQIIRVDPITKKWDIVVGNGEECLPGDESQCGDGSRARDAKLIYPKGIAFTSHGTMYVADGTNIRVVDQDGLINTLIGSQHHRGHWEPFPCSGSIPIHEVSLRWPTAMAVNPLDDTLYFIDDNLILRVTRDFQVRMVAGQGLHCPRKTQGYSPDVAAQAFLTSPQSLAFSQNGNLYVAESNSERVNRVRLIQSDGTIHRFAGADSKCNCLEPDCQCFVEAERATAGRFGTISSLAVSPDGVVHIADQGNLRIRSVHAQLPTLDEDFMYRVPSPSTKEMFVFNRFGQHVATRDLITGQEIYTFLYTVNTSNGKLSGVTDASGRKISILRDYKNDVNAIENFQNEKCHLEMSRLKQLAYFSSPEHHNITFTYQGAMGLLTSRLDNLEISFKYSYDIHGRLISAVLPTGDVVELAFNLDARGASVLMTQNTDFPVSFFIQTSTVRTMIGESQSYVSLKEDGRGIWSLPWDHRITLDPFPGQLSLEVAGELVNQVTWHYNKVKNKGESRFLEDSSSWSGIFQKSMWVNGQEILSMEYSPKDRIQAVVAKKRGQLLNITYDTLGRPIRWDAPAGLAPCLVKYDQYGRLIMLEWGRILYRYVYDTQGRIKEVHHNGLLQVTFSYPPTSSRKPQKIQYAGGEEYQMGYDTVGGLSAITTPRGTRHHFSLHPTFGSYTLLYVTPSSPSPYALSVSSFGQILKSSGPGHLARVYYGYGEDGLLSEELFGRASITYTYSKSRRLLRSVRITSIEDWLQQIDYIYHGGLLKQEQIEFVSTSQGSTLRAIVKYQYDGNARLSKVEIQINGQEKEAKRFHTSPWDARVERIDHLEISYPSENKVLLTLEEDSFTGIYISGEEGYLEEKVFTWRHGDIWSLKVNSNAMGKVVDTLVTVGNKGISTRTYAYNANGQLSEATVGDRSFAYGYDENGNLVRIKEEEAEVKLTYDQADRLASYDGRSWNEYDEDGRTVHSHAGELAFIYDAKSQLIEVYKEDAFRISYAYDHLGRLVKRWDHQGHSTIFFYTDPSEKSRVTFVHFPEKSQTLSLTYDHHGHLVVMERSTWQKPRQRFYVATDHVGSPLVVFSKDGQVVKTIERTPFGKILNDSNPDLYLPVDFSGGICDPQTGLIHFSSQVYDSWSAQYLNPSWMKMFVHLTSPLQLFIYRFRDNDPISPKVASAPLTMSGDLVSWLSELGYDLETLLGSWHMEKERLDRGGVRSSSLSSSIIQLRSPFKLISGLECDIHASIQSFQDLSLLTRGEMMQGSKSILPHLGQHLASRVPPFGRGILMSRSRIDGRAVVQSVTGANPILLDVITSVFNDSHPLDLQFLDGTQEKFYFVKTGPAQRNNDVEQLRRLARFFNVSTEGKVIRLYNWDTDIRIHYGPSVEEVQKELLAGIQTETIQKAWLFERSLVDRGFVHKWSPEEVQELLNTGVVRGYRGVLSHSRPDMSGDPANVVWERT